MGMAAGPEAFQLTEGRGLRHTLPRGWDVAAVDPPKFLIRSGWRRLLQVAGGLEGLVATASGMSWEAGEDPQPTHRRQLKSERPTQSNQDPSALVGRLLHGGFFTGKELAAVRWL
jgi:hypothetical protein